MPEDEKRLEKPEDKEAIHRKQLEDAEREAEEAGKRLKERLNISKKLTEYINRTLDEL